MGSCHQPNRLDERPTKGRPLLKRHTDKHKLNYRRRLLQVTEQSYRMETDTGMQTDMPLLGVALCLLLNFSEYCFGVFSDGSSFSQVSFVNSICTTKGGHHVTHVIEPLLAALVKKANAKNKGGMEIKAPHVKYASCRFLQQGTDSLSQHIYATQCSGRLQLAGRPRTRAWCSSAILCFSGNTCGCSLSASLRTPRSIPRLRKL